MMSSRRFIPRITPTEAQREAWRRAGREAREKHDALANEIVEWARSQGIAAATIDRDGVLDVFGPMPPTGRHWQIEVKTGGGDLTENQKDLEAALIRNGAAVYVVRSLEEAKRFLRLLHNGEKAKAERLAAA